MATSITQFGITWTFSEDRTTGQFADGSYWVLAPVTITSITPDFSGGENGWEVNPSPANANQGFTTSGPNYSSSMVPSLPYLAETDQSIVKAISGTKDLSRVKTAAVLTVLTSVPDGSGAGLFRPPYVGSSKPLYAVADLNTSLIPSLNPVGTPPSLATVVTRFSGCLRMDHHATNNRSFRPWDVMQDYQPKNINTVVDSMLRLMLNDATDEEKLPALVQLTQHCIDRAHCVLLGYRHGSQGHNPGHRLMAGWAASLLNITSVLSVLADEGITVMHDRHVSNTDGIPLWGESSSETAYWDWIRFQSGGRSNRDPYGYIDGGQLYNSPEPFGAGAAYQKLVSQNIKGEVLCALLMTSLQASYRASHWPTWRDYATRWVEHGVWSQPDPAAPYTSGGTYQVDYGPDPGNPGSPISGAGRYPAFHGANADGGDNRSAFVAAMWDAYRYLDQGEPPVMPGPGGRRTRRSSRLSALGPCAL